ARRSQCRFDTHTAVGFATLFRAALKRFNGLQHLIDMPWDFHAAPFARDLSVLVDQEGRALDAHVFPSVKSFLLPHAIGLAGFAFWVGGENDSKLVLGFELVVLRDSVLRHANDFGASLLKLLELAAETDC